MIKSVVVLPLLIILLSCFTPLFAQSFTISGYIQDLESSEKLIGANIYDADRQLGTTSNVYGFFSLTLPGDSLTLTISYIGYQTTRQRLFLDRDLQLNINLQPALVGSDTISVVAEAVELIEEKSLMSRIEVPMVQIRSLPSLLGEVDVLKTIQLLPGVQSGNEGTSGLYVRGGGPDQNLILLDGAPVYNASHLFGFFSVFNADAIKNVNLTKGGFPARYGGRLSSVVEINMKEGNLKNYNGQASVGLVSSRLMFEGPIVKDKSSFIFSGRRTYIDLLARPFLDESEEGGYYFYDLNMKMNHIFSHNNRIFFSVYAGDDRFYVDNVEDYGGERTQLDFDLGWGNITSTMRWNHVYNKKLFSNTTFTYSKYRFEIDARDKSENTGGQVLSSYASRYFSGIEDLGARLDFDLIPNPAQYIKFGGEAIYHRFSPGAFRYSTGGLNIDALDTLIAPSNEEEALEASFYLENDIKLTGRLKANLGVHASMFSVNGTTYNSWQPRVSMRYLLKADWSVKASYAAMTQYVHLLSNSGIGLPTDLWVPTTERVRPQESRQYALGVAHTIEDRQIEVSIEGYYKTMRNLIEYKDGADFLGLDTDWQNKIEDGEGRSYGVELFLQKKRGKTTGWLGYTLAWANRQFEDLNNGQRFPYKYDRRHDLSLVLSHQPRDGLELSATWVFSSGNSISLATAQYTSPGTLARQFWGGLYGGNINYYEGRNGYKMPAYHRLDIGVLFHRGKPERRSTWALGVYNLYNNKNPYFIYLGNNEAGEPAFKQVSLFPIIPSVSYRFGF